MTDRVRIDHEGHVAHVRLNRPDKRNGLDLAMFEALAAAGESLKTHNDVRAIVLSGEGGCFCAGLDVRSMMADFQGTQQALVGERTGDTVLAQQVCWVWQEVPVPVIAAIEGVAFGGGLQIALGADLRYAAPDAQLSVMEIRWGLIPDMSITQTLLPLVRPDVARELTWSGRVVQAPEAAELGLVTRVTDNPIAVALDTARMIAKQSPSAIRRSKDLYRRSPHLGIRAGFELETELQVELMGGPDQMEAIRANFEKREPRFGEG